MNKISTMIVTAMIAVSSFGGDLVQSVYNAADAAPSIRIKYNGSATIAHLSNTVNTLVLTDGTVANSIVYSDSTFATLLGDIAAATNLAGVANFQAELVNALSADTCTNKVLAITDHQDLRDGKWHETAYFDTSACLFYSVASYGDGMGARVLKNIFGDVKGTGDVSIKVYVDGAEKYSKNLQSPVYSTVDGTVVNTNANISAEIDLGNGIVISGDQKLSIRATRVTTATTGGIGASLEGRK